MADTNVMPDIPQPIQSVMTSGPGSDVPDVPPPVGYRPLQSNESVNIPPPPAGYVPVAQRRQAPPAVTRPQVDMQEQGLGSTLASAAGSAASAVGRVTSDLTQGIGEGALDTVHGTGELIRKGLNAESSFANAGQAGNFGDRLIPQVGQAALQKIATPDNTTQEFGKNLESVAEFIATSEIGGEAWGALSRSEQLGTLSKTVKFLEAHPVVRRAAIDAMSQGAQTLTKTGGDVGQAAEQAGTMGALSLGTGLATKPVTGLVNLLKNAGFAGDALDRAAYIASKEPGSAEIRSGINDALEAKEVAMHADFDKAITGIKEKIGSKVVPLADTPLYEAASEIKAASKTLPPELQDALTAVIPHSKDVEPLLNYLTEGSAADSGISGNELIELRQNINKSIKAADPSVKQVLGHLLEGIDNTIDDLEGGTSDTYRDARTSYRNTLNDFKNPFVKAIRANNVTDLVDGLTKGGNAAAKVNSLRNLIGDTAMQELGTHRFAESISNALDKTTGSLNLNKFIKDWSDIPAEVKNGMFANNPEDLTMLNGWIDQARKMSRTVSNVKWGARAAGVGLSALGATGLLGEDRGKDSGITGRDILSSAELLAGAAGLFGGKYASHTLQELLTDPAWLNRFGTIGRYNPYRTGLSPVQKTIGTATKVIGQAGRSAAITHVFDPASGLQPVQTENQPDQ